MRIHTEAGVDLCPFRCDRSDGCIAHCRGAAASVCQCTSGIHDSKVTFTICLAVDRHYDPVVIRTVQGRDSGGCVGNRAAVGREACQVGGCCHTGDDSLTHSDVAVTA